jgi:Taurine catabolism dioxygenase TauD, TfdA family
VKTSPFFSENEADYQAWRTGKLAHYPGSADELVVPVADPRTLTEAEHDALLDRIRRANMAIYATPLDGIADKNIPRRLGERFGLRRLDPNLLADDDGITSLTVFDGEGLKGEDEVLAGTNLQVSRSQYIPYSNRPINWHTDGYYNRPERRILAMTLHCVEQAESGGENAVLDHEIAYLLLRDENPEHIRTLMAPDAMTIPERTDENGVARAAETGPVFSVLPDGNLHMRYTARTRSIRWKDDAATQAAVQALEAILKNENAYTFRVRLQPGMGILCNNILHTRTGFTDGPSHRRLLYRARYYDRIAGSGLEAE